MKKLFVAAALALALTMASQQTASAWSECKFSVGLNFGWVGGGNRILWGAYHSAPYPGGQDVYPVFPGMAAALGYNFANAGYAPAVGGFDYAPPAPQVWEAPAPAHAGAYPMPSAPAGVAQQSWSPSYDSGYQPVSYFAGSYYQAPTAWYGR